MNTVHREVFFFFFLPFQKLLFFCQTGVHTDCTAVPHCCTAVSQYLDMIASKSSQLPPPYVYWLVYFVSVYALTCLHLPVFHYRASPPQKEPFGFNIRMQMVVISSDRVVSGRHRSSGQKKSKSRARFGVSLFSLLRSPHTVRMNSQRAILSR